MEQYIIENSECHLHEKHYLAENIDAIISQGQMFTEHH